MALHSSIRPVALLSLALAAVLAAGCQSTTRTSEMDSSNRMGAAGTGTTSGPGTTDKSGTKGSSPADSATTPGASGTGAGAAPGGGATGSGTSR